MQHPYKSAPDRAFWARSVAANWSPRDLMPSCLKLVRAGEKVASAGSCFAANIVPYLERAGLEYVRVEAPHPAFETLHQEAFSYHRFSAAYGNIYTARHLLQLVQRALGQFAPIEDRWYGDGCVLDPFRPGLRFPASDDIEFDFLTRQHLDAVVTMIRTADVFVFTLGLTEAWISVLDGATFPACPGTVAGTYDPGRHAFHNFTAQEVGEDLCAAFRLMRQVNPCLRMVLTVSPVPLVATATDCHALLATIYSKSVLRVAAQHVVRMLPFVTYFPAYEIVTGPQASQEFFEADRRTVARVAIDTVMDAFLACCDTMDGARLVPAIPVPGAPAGAVHAVSHLSAAVAQAECEEAASAV